MLEDYKLITIVAQNLKQIYVLLSYRILTFPTQTVRESRESCKPTVTVFGRLSWMSQLILVLSLTMLQSENCVLVISLLIVFVISKTLFLLFLCPGKLMILAKNVKANLWNRV